MLPENLQLEPDLQNDPIFSIECEEQDGTVVREVRELQLTHNNLTIFWQRARKFKTLFNKELRDDFKEFVKTLICYDGNGNVTSTGLFYVVDNFVGVFYVTEIRTNGDALAHYSFFDGRHEGRVELVKRMLKYAFDELGFRRLSAEVPKFGNNKTRNFVEKSLGFKYEGTKRAVTLLDGVWYDKAMYGLLKEELR